jgi:hypothetical protein
MNTFKRKALTCAVLAGLGATSAEAVVLNAVDNTGQVLIYPYYTVQTAGGNVFNTYMSITNTTSVAKVLKVRFREGKTSAEVLDFNLYLSPNDMWVGAIVADGSGTDSPARLAFSTDLSCTDPAIPTGGEPFKNFAYLASPDSLPGTTLDRTREGYIEVFEMAVLSGVAAANVTHPLAGGAPPNCAAMRSPDGLTQPAPLTGNMQTPNGGLYGNATLINVANGADYGYVADALDMYAFDSYYAGVGSPLPTLGGAQASPNSLRLLAQLNPLNNSTLDNFAIASNFGAAAVSGVTQGARAVASVYMHSAVMNDYVLDSGTLSNTDWVLTFPVKREFVTAVTAINPFTAVMTTAGACEPALFNIFNRDEASITPPSAGFSPQAPAGAPGVGNLCWESTVVSFRNTAAHTTASGTNSGVLGSRNSVSVPVPQNFQNGWASATFTGANATTAITGGLSTTASTTVSQFQAAPLATAARTFVGLPVTGFMVRTITNNAVDCTRGTTLVTGGCQGNYGSLFRHAYRNIVR